jgi:hypothetical protein
MLKIRLQPIRSSRREYHIYKFAANYLDVAEYQIMQREQQLRSQSANLLHETQNHQLPNLKKFVKQTKSAPVIKQLGEVEKTIEACKNIKRLCEEAYELGKKVRENKLTIDIKISEELYDFICLTNDSYACYLREDYEKIKMIYKTR